MQANPSPILLIEDEPNDVFLIQRACTKAQIVNPVRSVTDGEQAINYLTGQREFADRSTNPVPVLLLLDLKLPRKGGLEVLAWLRRQTSRLRRLPVVILTSSKQAIDVNLAYDLGANSYLVKPVMFDDLVSMMKTLNIYWCILNEQPALPE